MAIATATALATVNGARVPRPEGRRVSPVSISGLGRGALLLLGISSAVAQGVSDDPLTGGFKGFGVIGPGALGSEVIGPGDVSLTSGFTLSATYSDNARLNESSEERGEAIFLSLSPYIGLIGNRAPFIGRVYFAPTLYTSTAGDAGVNLANNNFLTLGGTAEVVDNRFFIDGFAKASMVTQSAAGPSGGVGSDFYLYDSDNLTQAFTAQISPYTRHRFGSFADLTTRLDLGIFRYSSSSENNARDAGFSATLRSGSDFPRAPWRVSYDISRYTYSDESNVDDGSSQFSRLVGGASYRISPLWSVDGSLGYDIDEYQSSRDQTSGIRWSLGTTWTPNPRIGLSLGYGGQYYGNDWYLDYRYSHKRVGWFARYRTELTNVQREYRESLTFLLTGPDGLPVIDPGTGQPVQVTQVDPTLTNETYVRRSFVTGIGWTGNRTSASLDVTRNEREYQVTGESESDWGIGGRVSRQLSAELTATGRVSWTSYDDSSPGDGGASDSIDRWRAGVGLTKRIGGRSSLSARYDYGNNLFGSADDDTGRENRVALIFNHAF